MMVISAWIRSDLFRCVWLLSKALGCVRSGSVNDRRVLEKSQTSSVLFYIFCAFSNGVGRVWNVSKDMGSFHASSDVLDDFT